MRHPLRSKICVALDTPDRTKVEELVSLLADDVGVFKVGKELFAAEGPGIIDFILQRDAEVFLDLKFHDIPNTVEKACRVVAKKNVSYLTVHASGGSSMLRAAAQGASGTNLKLLGVTVLTSLGDQDLKNDLKVSLPVKKYVSHLAGLSLDSGLAGVISSGQEAASIRQQCGDNFLIVTPGIRPEWASRGDQTRVVSPKQAIQDGADLLVIGRPITQAEDRLVAVHKILEEIS